MGVIINTPPKGFKISTISITNSIRYDDVITLVNGSMSAGFRPYIVAELTASGSTFHNVTMPLTNIGYNSVKNVAFCTINGDGSGSFHGLIEENSAPSYGTYTASNAVMYYAS